jgi:tRNA G37 N-methylase TrmD
MRQLGLDPFVQWKVYLGEADQLARNPHWHRICGRIEEMISDAEDRLHHRTTSPGDMQFAKGEIHALRAVSRLAGQILNGLEASCIQQRDQDREESEDDGERKGAPA